MGVGLFVVFLIGGLAQVVSAQEDGYMSGNAGAGQATQKQQAGGDQVQQQTQTRNGLSEKSISRIRALAKNMSDKNKAGVYRLEQISTRLEARINAAKNEGVATANAERQLQMARSYIAMADDLLENTIDSSVDTAVYSEKPRENWQTARADFLASEEFLNLAKQDLQTVIAELRNPTTAETTPEPTPDEDEAVAVEEEVI